jgi:hypothetical protein
MREFRHHHAFTQAWIKANLWWLRRLFNAPLVGRWLRRQMGLTLDGQVVDIRPDSIVIQLNERDYQYVGWTGDVISQFVYQTAKPLWWAIHYWDEWIADRWIPELSYGFNALDNVFEGNQAGPPQFRRFADSDLTTTNAWDLSISCEATSYSNARNGVTGSVFNVWRGLPGNTPVVVQVSTTQTNVSATQQNPRPFEVYRGFLHFNTSAMAGDRGQFTPGRIQVTWASVIAVPSPGGSISPGPIVLCQSSISHTKTTSQVVGSDFKQTPVSAPVDLATSRESGNRSGGARDASGNYMRIVPSQALNSAPLLYQWILKSGDTSTLTEIESYYYPPSLGTYGQHNGLARFCLRTQAEYTNQSLTQDQLNALYSRETAEAQSNPNNGVIYYTPRLVVNYTRADLIDVFPLKGTNRNGQPTDTLAQFGLATVSGPRVVRVPSITSNANPFIGQALARFGTPDIRPDREVEPVSLPLFTKIGTPMVPNIFARGFNVPVSFGTATVISPIRPPSITSNANPFVGQALTQFGSTRVESGPTVYPAGFKIMTEATTTQPGNFGLARVDVGIYRIEPKTIPVGVQFGQRTTIGHPFPDEVYANQIQDLPLQYQTVAFEYDGGRIENNVQVCGVRQWRIVYEGLSEEDVALLVAHFNKVQGRVGLFPFYHRRDLVVYENCRYAAFDIPSRIKKWSNAVTITIEREE